MYIAFPILTVSILRLGNPCKRRNAPAPSGMLQVVATAINSPELGGLLAGDGVGLAVRDVVEPDHLVLQEGQEGVWSALRAREGV